MSFNRRIKVLELIRTASGGMRQHYISLAKGLKGAGFDVLAACGFDKTTMEELRDEGIEVYPFHLPGEVQPHLDAMKAVKIAHIIMKQGVDVLHCHGFKAGVVGRVGAILAGCPKVYTVHNFVLPLSHRLKRAMLSKTEKVLAKRTEGIIAVSHALKLELERECGIPGDKVSVIYNGISLPHAGKGEDVRWRLGIGFDAIVIGSVARLIPSKGIQYLLDAIPLVKSYCGDIRFMIVGDGPYEGALKMRAKDLGVEGDVIFTGYVTTVWDYLDAMDVFVLPTLSEGLGVSILEAMAMGKPVVASNVGGIPEIIEHGQNGYLVPPGDAATLASAIIYLIRNAHVRSTFGQKGRERVMTHFSAERMVQATAQLLERCAHVKTHG
ncbi:glycosyltransferase family 4 protein [Caldicoprobacter faecalis]|uniref:Glycosyltransferase involved in cell wall bisynthesis n=1 Tax=Caldicoprobacter faecalis TaxID=937334 RepID=A0A1I5VG69_9FIRM|nr:glycosyltransferase family 4 protein [Caldicoprobacter faecalis]SFQ06463.1 Glycosyltransferase involved in cell wall bisynthesis [Caldicoprobacter faecalis]